MKKKLISLLLSILIVITVMPPISVFAEEQEVLAQYTGSTSAGWGYKPNCTFTICK